MSAPGADARRVVRLYSRDGCHLCERARDVVEYAREHEAFSIAEFDIDADPALRAKYRDTIPVVAAGGRELEWPFRLTDVLGLVRGAFPEGVPEGVPEGAPDDDDAAPDE